MKKRRIPGFLSTVIISSMLLSTIQANDDYSIDYTGQMDIHAEILAENAALSEHIFPEEEDLLLQSVSSSSLPSSVDLSTSIYFPPIQNQGSEGSCVAFSVNYYQFTYEANKLNNINSSSSNSWYSPVWSYYAGSNSNNGTNAAFVYNFIKDHGSFKWNDLTPTGSYQGSSLYPTDDTKMLEALKTRIDQWYTYTIPSQGTPITSNTDSDLTTVKTLLNNGKVLRVSSWFNFNSVDTGSKLIHYRCCSKATSHSFVIVGYDDNVSYDVNGNGIIDAGEKGAFKIANSWDTYYGYGGYAWILYDALNSVSSISGNWEDSLESNVRFPAFCTYSNIGNNTFNAITVKNYDTYFIAKMSYTNTPRNNTHALLYASSVNSSYETTPLISNKTSNFNIYYDYNPIYTSVDMMISGTAWKLKLVNTQYTPDVDLVDDRNNIISSMNYETNNTNNSVLYSTDTITLVPGDVNYDGKISTADVSSVQKYLSDWDNLSTLQIKLADYNGDGKVNSTDTSDMLKHIAGWEGYNVEP